MVNFFTVFKVMMNHDCDISPAAKRPQIAEPDEKKTPGKYLKGCHEREIRYHEHSKHFRSSQTWFEILALPLTSYHILGIFTSLSVNFLFGKMDIITDL